MNFAYIGKIVDSLIDKTQRKSESMDTPAAEDNTCLLGVDSEEIEKKLKAYRYLSTYVKKLSPGPFLIDTRADISPKDAKYFAEYGYDKKTPPYEADLVGKKIDIGDLKGCTVVFCGRALSFDDLCISEHDTEAAEKPQSAPPRKPQLTSHYIWWVRVPDTEKCPSIVLKEVRDCWHGMRPALFVLPDIKNPEDGFFYNASPFTEQMFMQCDFDVVLRRDPPNTMQVRGIEIPILPIEQVQKKAMAKRNNTKDPDAVVKLRTEIATSPAPAPKKVSKPLPTHVHPRMFPRYRYVNKDEADSGILFKRFLRDARLEEILNPESEFVGNVAEEATLGLCFDKTKVADIHPEIKQIESITTDKVEYEEIDPNLPKEEYYKQKYQQEKMKSRQAARDSKFENAMVSTHALYGHVKWDKVQRLVQESLTSPSFAVHEVAPLFFDVWSKNSDLLVYRKTGPTKNVTTKRQLTYFNPDRCKQTATVIQTYLSRLEKESKENVLPDVWVPCAEPEHSEPPVKDTTQKPGKSTKKKQTTPKAKESADKDSKGASAKKGTEHKKEDTKDAAGDSHAPNPKDSTEEVLLDPEPTTEAAATAAEPSTEPIMPDKKDQEQKAAPEDDAFLALMNSAKKMHKDEKTTREESPAQDKDMPNDTDADDEDEESPAKDTKPKPARKRPSPKFKQTSDTKQPLPASEDDKPSPKKASPTRRRPPPKAKPTSAASDDKEVKEDTPVPPRKRPSAAQPADDKSPPQKKTKCEDDSVEVSVSSVEEAKAKLKKLHLEVTANDKQITKVGKEHTNMLARKHEYEKSLVDLDKCIKTNEDKITALTKKKTSIQASMVALEKAIEAMKKQEELEAKKKLLGKRTQPDTNDTPESPKQKKVHPAPENGRREDGDTELGMFVMNYADEFSNKHGANALTLAIEKSIENKLILPESIRYDDMTLDQRKQYASLATLFLVYLKEEAISDEIRESAMMTESNIVRHLLSVLVNNEKTLTTANVLKRYEGFEKSDKKKEFLQSLAIALAAFYLRFEQLKTLLPMNADEKDKDAQSENNDDDDDDDDSDIDIPGFV